MPPTHLVAGRSETRGKGEPLSSPPRHGPHSLGPADSTSCIRSPAHRTAWGVSLSAGVSIFQGSQGPARGHTTDQIRALWRAGSRRTDPEPHCPGWAGTAALPPEQALRECVSVHSGPGPHLHGLTVWVGAHTRKGKGQLHAAGHP